ncbi:dirigent protein 7-like [Selaginella moellendorffii]|uniref:dirigent protein 7-like n=1 Tax=Selaginella moellendorffii TaxID=88036 RepID=UPI000D1D0FBC|nr:dirigent protein 7-like [Selaginella moellendorffii]|eukprot:XP_024517004.1 dirigent protein 7-like [Selaginella moellendorffii]
MRMSCAMKIFIPLVLTLVFAIAPAQSSLPNAGELDLSKCTEVIRFYLQDQFNGSNPTTAIVLPPRNNETLFGQVAIFYDKLTTESSINSKLVGRAKGFLVIDSLGKSSFLQIMMELEGRKGTIVLHGQNPFTESQREIAVVGGTGEFRNVQGYALTSTTGAEPGGLIAIYEVHLVRLWKCIWKCFNMKLIFYYFIL